MKFMWLTPTRHSLVQFVAAFSDEFPEKAPAKLSLTTSRGFKTLIELRNEATWRLAPKPVPTCSLFDGAGATAGPAKRPRARHHELDASGTVMVQLPAVDCFAARTVPFKRPAHPCERLASQSDEGGACGETDNVRDYCPPPLGLGIGPRGRFLVEIDVRGWPRRSRGVPGSGFGRKSWERRPENLQPDSPRALRLAPTESV